MDEKRHSHAYAGHQQRYTDRDPAELPGGQLSPVEISSEREGDHLAAPAENSTRWSNSPTVSSWSSPGIGGTQSQQSRSSVSPVMKAGQMPLLAAREREGVHELG
jgi:hypothetical protein